MKLDQVALQLYTLRDFCRTSGDLAQTARRVREMGYPAVEVAGIGPISPAEAARILRGEGLEICSVHEEPDLIRHAPQQVAARLQDYGVSAVVYPYPANVHFGDPANVKAMISDLDHAGKILSEAGCVLSYHHHAIEFIRLGEEILLDHLFRATVSTNLHFELDTYWIQYGGGNPVEWCRKVAGRMELIHLKDYAFTVENRPTFAEIGAGTLDFGGIIPAAEAAGARWFIVEQDACPGDPFESVRQSWEFIREELAE